MARPLRIEFPGAVYHVTSCGDRREPVFADDADRAALLDVVAQAMARFDVQVLSYCLMGNHYHFVLHTRLANLSRLMRHINGVYTQAFNRRYERPLWRTLTGWNGHVVLSDDWQLSGIETSLTAFRR